MKRKLSVMVLIIITAFLQCCLFELFAIASIKPNLLLIITVSFGLMRGKRSGLLTGFFCGLVLDICFPGQLGLQSLIYMWLGYGAGYFYRIFYDDDIKTPLLLTAGASILYGTYQYAATFLLRGRINYLFYLNRIIIPEMVYTLMLTLVTYGLLYRINRRLSKTDKRSVDSLV